MPWLKRAAIALGLIAFIAIPAELLYPLLDPETKPDFPAAGALSALLSAALAAAWKFSLFRESDPHLTITQEISADREGEETWIVTVNATLHNTSRVVVRPSRARCQLIQTGPITKEALSAIAQQAKEHPRSDAYLRYSWYLLDQDQRSWPKGNLKVEPNQKTQIAFQFMINAAVTRIGVITAILEEDKSQKNPQPLYESGWTCYTPYNLLP